MMLADLHELLDQHQNINDYADFDLVMPDGCIVTGITVDEKESIIYLSDTEEGIRFI